MTSTITREMARHAIGERSAASAATLLRSAEILCAVIAVIIVAVLFALDTTIATAWLNPQALPAASIARGIDLIGVLVALRLLEGIYHGALVGLQKLVWYNGWAVAFATLRHGGAAVVVLSVSPTIEAYFAWQIVVSVAATALYAWEVHRAIPGGVERPRLSVDELRSVAQFAAGTSAVTLLTIVLSQVDKVLLSRMISLEAFGYYMLASSVASALYLAVVPLAQAVHPRMVELASRVPTSELSALYHRSTTLVTVIGGTASAVLCLFPVAAIFTWSGDPTIAARVAPVLIPAVLGTFLHALTYLPYQLQLAHGWTALSVRAQGLAALIYLPALFWVVPAYGGVGAAWLWVALNLMLVAGITTVMHRRLPTREHFAWIRSDVLIPLAAAGAGAVVAAFVLQAVTGIVISNEGSAFAASGTGGSAMSRIELGLALTAVAIVALGAAAAAAPNLRQRSSLPAKVAH